MIRTASVDDLPQLLRLENTCFQTDRLSRRQFRYMLTRANAIVLTDVENERLRGYVLILFSRGTSMARLYSIAVDPEARGCGVARALVEAAETESRERDCAYLRLEVRKDNAASLGLFRAMGYRQFDERPDYYEDHMDAWRFEKSLAPNLAADLGQVAYYEQTLDFTCGPAALMMAMKSLAPEMVLDRKLELRLWREATTIYMTSGHGGCGPFGLALAASRRGFTVEVYVSDEGVHLIDTVRSEEKKAVIRLVQEDMRDELLQCGVPIHYESLSLDELEKRFNDGGLPVVLISSYQIYEERFPHWVVVTGFDEHFVYANDPFVDYDNNETRVDSINMPIHKRNFQRMARYGRAGLRAVLMLYRGADPVGNSA